MKPRIVLVDDSPVIHMLCGQIFGGMGFEFQGFKDGREAMEFVQHHDLDLMILDIELSGMDGMEVASYVRSGKSRNAELPIIAISGNNHNYTAEDFSKLQINDYLIKPLDYDNLVGVVLKTLQNDKIHPELPQ